MPIFCFTEPDLRRVKAFMLKRVIIVTIFIPSFINYPLTTIDNEEIFLYDFLENLKRSLHNF